LPQLVTTIQGLTPDEVAERVARGETNAFKARVSRTYWDIARDNIFNLFNIVMFSLLLTVLTFGDYATVLFAGFSVFTNSVLGMAQEINAKRKLDQLAALSAPEVNVYRGGEIKRIKIDEIVKDDVIPLEPGDRLVVDGYVLHSDALEMDESQLTGESDAVLKEVNDPVYSGSFCIAGSGVMVATVVGAESRINQLSVIAKTYRRQLTPTQRRLALIVRISVFIMAVCVPMIFLASFLTQGSVINLNTFRDAVVFVASIVPQGLVLTATISLTIGAVIISRQQTLVQRVNAVESMANVTVLCFDKTGTLTQNVLAVNEIIPLANLPKDELEANLKLYLDNLSHQNRTAAAVATHLNGSSDPGPPAIVKKREVPFTSARKWGAIVLEDHTLVLGAPERVLTPEDVEPAARAQNLAAQGYRVLAFARVDTPMLDGALSEKRTPLALIVLSDQVRPDIQDTLRQFKEQNVELKIISGDNLETVREVAYAAGMTIRSAYTGDILEQMPEAEFKAAVLEGDLFARVEPNTKRRIVRALKEQGHYVAMTGDGVNDVPALKEANLAVVMNDGAQISKDIADIVLLNNALTTLPRAFFEGRTIRQTIFGTSKIYLVKNLYSLLFFIFAGFMAMPFPINPIQISWVTFGVVNVPATLLTFRFLKPEFMSEFRRDVFDYVISAGVIGAIALSMVYAINYLIARQNIIEARSSMLVFFTLYSVLVYWNVFGIYPFEPRTITAKPLIFGLGILLATITLVAPYLFPDLLDFVAPSLAEWVVMIVVCFLAALALHYAMKTRAMVDTIWRLTAP